MEVDFSPQPPAVYEYTVYNRRQFCHKMADRSVTSDFQDTNGFVFNILKHAEGKMECSVVFSGREVASRHNENEQKTEDRPEAYQKALSVFKGLVLTVHYDSLGKITYLQGYDKFPPNFVQQFHFIEQLITVEETSTIIGQRK